MVPASVYVLLTLSAIFWGGTFVAGRQLSAVDPFVAAFLRFLLASVLLVAWTYFSGQRLVRLRLRQWLGVFLLGLTGVFIYNFLFFSGLQSVEAGRAALIIAINPAMIALLSWWLFREPLGGVRGIGIGLSMIGAALVISRGEPMRLLAGEVGLGEWMIFGCVLSWVAYTLIGKRILHGLSALHAVTYASMLGTLMLGLASMWPMSRWDTLAQVAVWDLLIPIAYLSLFGTVLAFVWFYKGVQILGAARAGQFINLVPVSGVAFGIWLLHEPLTQSLLLGGGLVLLGLWMTNRPIQRLN